MRMPHAAVLTGFISPTVFVLVLAYTHRTPVPYFVGVMLFFASFLAGVVGSFLLTRSVQFRNWHNVGEYGMITAGVGALVFPLEMASYFCIVQFYTLGDLADYFAHYALEVIVFGLAYGGLPSLIGGAISRHMGMRNRSMKVFHAALLTGLLYAIVLYSFNLVVDSVYLAGEVFLLSVVGAFFFVNMGLAFFIARRVMFQSRGDVWLFGFVSALVVTVSFFLALGTSPVQTLTDGYGGSAVYGIAASAVFGGFAGLIGATLSRRPPSTARDKKFGDQVAEAWRPSRVDETISAAEFDVPVNVPSVGKTVTLEVSPDHTVGSLVESVASTLKLPKGRTYAVEYGGKLIGQSEFGKTLATFGINEGSRLSLRVVE